MQFIPLELLSKTPDNYVGTSYTYQVLNANKEPTSITATATDDDLRKFYSDARMRKFTDQKKSGGYSKRTNRRTKRSTKRHTKRRSRHSRRK